MKDFNFGQQQLIILVPGRRLGCHILVFMNTPEDACVARQHSSDIRAEAARSCLESNVFLAPGHAQRDALNFRRRSGMQCPGLGMTPRRCRLEDAADVFHNHADWDLSQDDPILDNILFLSATCP
jgi:hypothetical protein